MARFNKFNLRTPYDRSDPGFTIPGVRLRWLNSKVIELTHGRLWSVLRKGDLDEKLVKHMTDYNPNVFSNGDTIRRGELVLGFATEEAAATERKRLNEGSLEAKQQLKQRPQKVNNLRKMESEAEDVSLEFASKEVKEGTGATRFSKT